MKSTRIMPGAIVVGAVAVASMFAASPAAAATLPPGQKITVVDSWQIGQFYNVNPADAHATPVGSGDPALEEYVSGVDVDDTGHGYATATYFDGEITEDRAAAHDDVAALALPYGIPVAGVIFKADANTGVLSDQKDVVIDLPGEEDPFADECSAVDYSKGVVTAVCYTGYGTEDDTTYVGTVDVTTYVGEAILTPFLTIAYEVGEGEELDVPNPYIAAIATNPIDGKLYGFTEGFTPASWIIPTDGSDPEFLSGLYYYVYGADFDRSGQLWLTAQEVVVPEMVINESYLELATYDFAGDSVAPIANFNSAAPYEIWDSQSITVWGVLAATGATVTPTAPVIAAGVLLLGAVLAAGALVLRRRSADA